MADPVSLFASAAGIAAAGIQLSSSLYRITETVVNAPKEIGEIAHEIVCLTSILENLRTVLEEGQDVYKPRLVTVTKSILTDFEVVQKKVQKLIGNDRKFNRFRWVYKSIKVKELMSKIEVLKSAMSLALSTIQMAMAHTKSNAAEETPIEKDKPKRLRKLVETLLRANRQTIVKLQEEARDIRVSRDEVYEYTAAGRVVAIQTGGEPLDDTATWLYRLVFAPETLSRTSPSTARSSGDADAPTHVVKYTNTYDADKDVAGVLDRHAPRRTRELLPPPLERHWKIETSMVEDLLTGWTRLSLEQIRASASSDNEKNSGPEITEMQSGDDDPSTTSAESDDEDVIIRRRESSTGFRNYLYAEPSHYRGMRDYPFRPVPPPRPEAEAAYQQEIAEKEAEEKYAKLEKAKKAAEEDRAKLAERYESELSVWKFLAQGNPPPVYSNGKVKVSLSDMKSSQLALQESPTVSADLESHLTPHSPPFERTLDSIVFSVNARRRLPRTSALAASLQTDGLESFFGITEPADTRLAIRNFSTKSLEASSKYRTLQVLDRQRLEAVYMRGNEVGQTWFFGRQPIHVNFFHIMYRPQLDSSASSHEEGVLTIGKEWIEVEALRILELEYNEDSSGYYVLQPALSYEDIENLVATSLMLREARMRREKRYLEAAEVAGDDGTICGSVNTSDKNKGVNDSAAKPSRPPRTLSSPAFHPMRFKATVEDASSEDESRAYAKKGVTMTRDEDPAIPTPPLHRKNSEEVVDVIPNTASDTIAADALRRWNPGAGDESQRRGRTGVDAAAEPPPEPESEEDAWDWSFSKMDKKKKKKKKKQKKSTRVPDDDVLEVREDIVPLPEKGRRKSKKCATVSAEAGIEDVMLSLLLESEAEFGAVEDEWSIPSRKRDKTRIKVEKHGVEEGVDDSGASKVVEISDRERKYDDEISIPAASRAQMEHAAGHQTGIHGGAGGSLVLTN